jgi:hypothetical protein
MKTIFTCPSCKSQRLDRPSSLKDTHYLQGYYLCNSCGKKLPPSDPSITFIHHTANKALYNDKGFCIQGYDTFLNISTKEISITLISAPNKSGYATGNILRIRNTNHNKPIPYNTTPTTKEQAEQQEIKNTIELMQVYKAPEPIIKTLQDKLNSYNENQISLFKFL